MTYIPANIDDRRAASASPTQNLEMVVRKGWNGKDFLHLLLNDHLEEELSLILRYDPVIGPRIFDWAKNMALLIPGYNSWEEARNYTWQALRSCWYQCDVPSTQFVGSEDDLVEILSEDHRNKYDLRHLDSEMAELHDSDACLKTAMNRAGILESYRGAGDNRRNRLVSKIYHAYKLREMLIGQTGNYVGSLEVRAHLTSDFEFWMFLIQLKLRRPDRQFDFVSPKPMKAHRTSENSPLSWNNQFSISFGLTEFAPDAMPLVMLQRAQAILIEMALSDTGWPTICTALNGVFPSDELHRARSGIAKFRGGLPRDIDISDPALGCLKILDLARAIQGARLKDFFSLTLGMTWNDEPYHRVDGRNHENAFEHLTRYGSEADRNAVEQVLHDKDLKDPRLDRTKSKLQRLSETAAFYSNAGRSSNMLLKPECVRARFIEKLNKMSDEQRQRLYQNTEGASKTVEQIADQAVCAAKLWIDGALVYRRPMATGPSGHALTYMNIYLMARAQRGRLESMSKDLPNLEEVRLVQLAGLIGYNKHHSYDEVMFALAGVSDPDLGELLYSDREGFADILVSNNETCRRVGELLRTSAVEIAKQTIARLAGGDMNLVGADLEDMREELKDGEEVVRKWLMNAVDVDLSEHVAA